MEGLRGHLLEVANSDLTRMESALPNMISLEALVVGTLDNWETRYKRSVTTLQAAHTDANDTIRSHIILPLHSRSTAMISIYEQVSTGQQAVCTQSQE